MEKYFIYILYTKQFYSFIMLHCNYIIGSLGRIKIHILGNFNHFDEQVHNINIISLNGETKFYF